MGEQEYSKWEGEAVVARVEIVWQLLVAEFSSADKWFPHIEKCNQVEGVRTYVLGEPGMVRCCESSQIRGSGAVGYAKEKLLMIDPAQMCFAYEMVENSFGCNSYDATMQLFPIDSHDDGRCGCKLVWKFVADPVEGFTLESLLKLFKEMTITMAKKMEEAL